MSFDAQNITKEEFDEIVKRAKKGDAEYQYRLARIYDLYTSKFVVFDVKKAFKYYKLAADQGHSNAQMYVGYCYEMGEGVKKNIKKCVEYYDKAALQGNYIAELAAQKYKK